MTAPVIAAIVDGDNHNGNDNDDYVNGGDRCLVDHNDDGCNDDIDVN